jgi:predicted RNase H-like HicB family nuclease
VGLCAEFPSLSHLAETGPDALAGIKKLVGAVISDMSKSREEVPEPLSLR